MRPALATQAAKAAEPGGGRRIVVLLDATSPACSALDRAVSQACECDGTIEILAVATPPVWPVAVDPEQEPGLQLIQRQIDLQGELDLESALDLVPPHVPVTARIVPSSTSGLRGGPGHQDQGQPS